MFALASFRSRCAKIFAGGAVLVSLACSQVRADWPTPLTMPPGYTADALEDDPTGEPPWFLAPSPYAPQVPGTHPVALFPPPGPDADGFIPVQQRPMSGSQAQPRRAIDPMPMTGGDDKTKENENGDEEKDNKTEENDFKALLDQIEENETNIEAIHNDLDGFVIPGTKNSTMKIVGRIHIDAIGFPGDSPAVNVFETGDPEVTPQNRVGFRRVRFGVRGDVWDTMEYRIETEIAGADNFQWRDVWLGFNDTFFADAFLIGNQKRPFGLDHLNSSRFNIFVERPFIVEALNEDARRLGVQNYWFTEDLRYNMRAGLFTLRKIQGDRGIYTSNHLQGQAAGRFATTYLWEDEGEIYGHFAVSGAIAEPDGDTPSDPDPFGSGRARNEARVFTRAEARSVRRWLDTGRIRGASVWSIMGVEKAFNYGPFQVVGEYMISDIQRNDFAVPPGRDSNLFMHGGYVYFAYVLTGEHMPWNRKNGLIGRLEPKRPLYKVEPGCECDPSTGLGAWQVALRFSTADLTDEDVFGGEGDSVTAALVWYWNSNASVQFNYGWGHIDHRNVTTSAAPGAIFEGGDYEFAHVRGRIDF